MAVRPVEFDSLNPEDAEADGAMHLFGLLADGSPQAYAEWADDYFGVPVDRAAIASVLSGQTLTPALASALNPETNFAKLAIDVAAMGYPVAGSGES